MLTRLAVGGALVAARPCRRRCSRLPLAVGLLALLLSWGLSWLA